jgi:hypothetical protein
VKKITFPILALGTVSLIALGVNSSISKAQDAAFSNAQKEALGTIIKDYIMENPEIIFEAADKHRANQENADEAAFDEKRLEYSAFLYENDSSPSVGNPDADVVIVEFFDYNCGYCKKALSDVQTIIKEDDNVRFVFKEMPILSPASRDAAKWALAANKQGKYFEYHVGLMNMSGAKSVNNLEKLAKDLGLDVDQMKKDANDPETDAMIDKNLLVSQELGIRGTPAFIIDDFLARGYMGIEGMKTVIKNAREKNKS